MADFRHTRMSCGKVISYRIVWDRLLPFRKQFVNKLTTLLGVAYSEGLYFLHDKRYEPSQCGIYQFTPHTLVVSAAHNKAFRCVTKRPFRWHCGRLLHGILSPIVLYTLGSAAWTSPNNVSAIAEMAAQWCTSRIFATEWGYLCLTHSFSVISENIATNHI